MNCKNDKANTLQVHCSILIIAMRWAKNVICLFTTTKIIWDSLPCSFYFACQCNGHNFTCLFVLSDNILFFLYVFIRHITEIYGSRHFYSVNLLKRKYHQFLFYIFQVRFWRHHWNHFIAEILWIRPKYAMNFHFLCNIPLWICVFLLTYRNIFMLWKIKPTMPTRENISKIYITVFNFVFTIANSTDEWTNISVGCNF